MYHYINKNSLIYILISAISLVIAGCATQHSSAGDGAPGYYVDTSKIKDPIPTPLPLSKSGNNPTYTVNGHTYHVLKSYKNYVATGTASWYGTRFNGHATSSGEPYNLLQMTAASKVLPIPCYAQVTNLQNGKTVIVKVNDRGPFEKNRLMDLSYAAALKLGIVGNGTAHVRVAAIDPDRYRRNPHYLNQLIPPPNPSHSAPTFYIQAAALHDKTHAEHLMQQLQQNLHAPAAIYTSNGKTDDHLYHVKIGPIYGRTNATQLITHMQQVGIAHPIYTSRA